MRFSDLILKPPKHHHPPDESILGSARLDRLFPSVTKIDSTQPYSVEESFQESESSRNVIEVHRFVAPKPFVPITSGQIRPRLIDQRRRSSYLSEMYDNNRQIYVQKAAQRKISMLPKVILATGDHDQTIRLWEVPEGVSWRTMDHFDSQVNRVTLSPDRKFLAAAGNPNVRLYDMTTHNPSPIITLKGHKHNVTAVGFIDDNIIYTGGEDGTLKLWDVRERSVKKTFNNFVPDDICAWYNARKSMVNDVAKYPSKNKLVSIDAEGYIKFWDIRSESNTSLFHQVVGDDIPASPLHSLSIAQNDSIMGYCYAWDLISVNATNTLPNPIKHQAHGSKWGNKSYITKCLLNPDARYLATCGADQTAKIWRILYKDETNRLRNNTEKKSMIQGFEESLKFEHPTPFWVKDCVWSNDSRIFITGKLWRTATGELVQQFKCHKYGIICVFLHEFD
ncbi:2581_t:CDS:10 [Scutellospora calospora]|uniref:2581_t:CDS:1 n=1 Tax=Scutellospora calospora TaxID=85575 RepID=A0ACA9KJL9_9GLOM|nr:2581_t:CDS:10 [Scutellospora calospora]